jgi:phenylacetate-CoA ligase
MSLVHKDLNNPYYIEWLQFLKNSEDWSKEQIETYQFEQLKKMINYAWDNTNGYRALWSQYGVSPQSFKIPEDINKFPCISKEDIRDRLDDFTVKVPDMEYTSTGSSTGIPFGFYRTPKAFGRELASKAHQYYRVGWKEGVPQLVFRGTPINTEEKIEFYPEFNELRCSSYYMTDKWMDLFCKRAMEYRPLWLRCYPSTGFLFAKFVKESAVSFPQLDGILCTSENLYDFQKQYLHDTFNCRVFNHYGHFELAALAGYCEYVDTLHVLPQYGFVQLIDENGRQVTKRGKVGEVVASSFLMNSTCFIRYRTQDFAVYAGEQCPCCGRPYQIWERIEGRLQEYFVTKSNRYISMSAINMHDDIFNDLFQFQYFQEEPGKVILKYIPKNSFNSLSAQKIKDKLLYKFNNDVDLTLREVGENEIYRTPRGKCLYLHQKIKLEIANVYRNL